MRGTGGAVRRRRSYNSGGNGRPAGPIDGGLVGGMFRRQATGKGGLGAAEILSARGEFVNRMRRQFEGVPEMIIEARKALRSGRRDAHSKTRISVVLAWSHTSCPGL